MSDTLSMGPSPPIISPVTEKLRISWPVPGTQWSDDWGMWGTQEVILVNYNELTTSSLEIIVSKGNHPQMALIQVSELL